MKKEIIATRQEALDFLYSNIYLEDIYNCEEMIGLESMEELDNFYLAIVCEKFGWFSEDETNDDLILVIK